MRVPTMTGVIARRILVNFQVDLEALAAVVPAPFRPAVVNGRGIGGICLIRLAELRPQGLPAAVGVGSENAAHRIAVEWDEHGQTRTGVYVPRRDTDSRLNTLVGGTIFPGVHHLATFTVAEAPPRFEVAMASRDGAASVQVTAALAADLPEGSAFGSLAEASAFFEAGSLGYSPAKKAGCFDGLELQTQAWKMDPLAVSAVSSSFFEDPARFPAGSVAFDSAFLMRQIPHTWHAREPKRGDR